MTRRLLAVAMLILSGCAGSRAPVATLQPVGPVATAVVVPTVPTDPLDQAVIAFDGNHSRAEIKAQLDQALGLYDLALTTENYRRSASSLVALRQSASGAGCEHCSEMEILRAMIRAGRLGNMTFPDGAAFAVPAIQALE